MSAEGLGKNQPLAIEVEDGVLHIRIGVDALAYAVQCWPEWPCDDNCEPLFRITDNDKFATEFVRELKREEEDGSTLLHRAFDKAATEVIEQGGEGVEEVRP